MWSGGILGWGDVMGCSNTGDLVPVNLYKAYSGSIFVLNNICSHAHFTNDETEKP